MPAQAYPCPCGGSNDYCGCQDFQRVNMMTAEQLLDWMTHHHLPLQIFREEDGGWVIVDGSRSTVMASGETVLEALLAATQKERT